MIDKKHSSNPSNSYLQIRKTVGWIGILIPFVLLLGDLIIFQGSGVRESISHYYYSNMRNVLVGALCAVALFLFFYSGYDKWDNWVGNIAGFFAICVAWVPTSEIVAATLIGKIHLISAGLFFSSLAIFSIFLFTRSDNNPTPHKRIRNKIYIICGLIMITCLLAIMIYYIKIGLSSYKSCFVYWVEVIALVAFGVSWLTKGGTLYSDKK